MSLQTQSIWYVYELADPLTGIAFYIGKGKGARVDQHEKDAAKADGVCSEKINKIKELWAKGLQVQKRINAMFWDEQAAYDHETDLIDEIGLENLTNIMPGGQRAWAKRKAKRAASREKPFSIHTMLDAKDEKMFVLFRNWFYFGLHHGDRKVKVEVTGIQNASLYAQITEVAYNHFMPMLLDMIRKTDGAFEKFAKRMRPYNVEFVNGCA